MQRNFLEVNIKDYPKETMMELAQGYDAEKVRSINQYAHTYVACVGNKVVACGSISSYFGKEDESILLSIFVAPQLQGNGIGKQIMASLENDEYFARAKRVEIPSSITACEFYRKLGYDYKNGINELDQEGHYRLEKFNIT